MCSVPSAWINVGMGLGYPAILVRRIIVREGDMRREFQRQEQGWSLTELLSVLAIMGVMAVLAGPSYQAVAARVQARSATVEIASELRLAGSWP